MTDSTVHDLIHAKAPGSLCLIETEFKDFGPILFLSLTEGVSRKLKGLAGELPFIEVQHK